VTIIVYVNEHTSTIYPHITMHCSVSYSYRITRTYTIARMHTHTRISKQLWTIFLQTLLYGNVIHVY